MQIAIITNQSLFWGSPDISIMQYSAILCRWFWAYLCSVFAFDLNLLHNSTAKVFCLPVSPLSCCYHAIYILLPLVPFPPVSSTVVLQLIQFVEIFLSCKRPGYVQLPLVRGAPFKKLLLLLTWRHRCLLKFLHLIMSSVVDSLRKPLLNKRIFDDQTVH